MQCLWCCLLLASVSAVLLSVHFSKGSEETEGLNTTVSSSTPSPGLNTTVSTAPSPGASSAVQAARCSAAHKQEIEQVSSAH